MSSNTFKKIIYYYFLKVVQKPNFQIHATKQRFVVIINKNGKGAAVFKKAIKICFNN